MHNDLIECLLCDHVYGESKDGQIMTCPNCGNDDFQKTIYLTKKEDQEMYEIPRDEKRYKEIFAETRETMEMMKDHDVAEWISDLIFQAKNPIEITVSQGVVIDVKTRSPIVIIDKD